MADAASADASANGPPQSVAEDVARLADVLAKASVIPSPAAPISARRVGKKGKATKGNLVTAPKNSVSQTQTPSLSDVQRTVSGVLGKGTSASITGDDLGWSADSLVSGNLALSADGLTATGTGASGHKAHAGAKQDAQYGGVVGAVRFSPHSGTHHFSIFVRDPIDDAYWIGICYPEEAGFFPDVPPKSNPHCIVWSGGSGSSGGRPGTVRLHSEKFREQPRYSDQAVVGIVVDTDVGDLSFWINGSQVIEFSGSTAGKVCAPFFSCTGSVAGPAATLMRWPLARDYSSANSDRAAAALEGASANMAGTVEIDGSILEGGGQVLRVSLAAAALTQTPIHVTRIRAGRGNPGLGHQHATGARLVAQGCGAVIEPESLLYGAHLEGVTTMRLWPGVRGVEGGRFVADTQSAGAVTLLLQAALPCFLLGQPREDVHLELRGGTNVRGAPSIEYFQHVLVPLIERMGVRTGSISTDVVSRGWYPTGGGEVRGLISPACRLNPLVLVERGEITKVRGVVVASLLARKHAKAAAEFARQAICETFDGKVLPSQVSVRILLEESLPTSQDRTCEQQESSSSEADDRKAPTFKQRRQMAKERAAMTDAAMQCQLILTTTTGAVHAADCLLETAKNRGAVDPTDLANTAVKRLAESWGSRGCVDEHTMDQLILFMALAQGRSEVLCNAESSISSLHLTTAIHFTTMLTGATFNVTTNADGTRHVSCLGVGWVNE